MTHLREFATQHRLHYDVQPEFLGAGPDREPVGFAVRLFARHERSRLRSPACARCVELSRELASFAEQLVSEADLAARAELVPGGPVLYESPEERTLDEVELTLRVPCEPSGLA